MSTKNIFNYIYFFFSGLSRWGLGLPEPLVGSAPARLDVVYHILQYPRSCPGLSLFYASEHKTHLSVTLTMVGYLMFILPQGFALFVGIILSHRNVKTHEIMWLHYILKELGFSEIVLCLTL